MKLLKKYKLFIGIALLALYVFAATPVQVWHHHNYERNVRSSTSSVNQGKIAFAADSGKSSEADCFICSHEYAAYFNDAITLILAIPVIQRSSLACYHLSIPAAPLCSLSNKGPPALS